MLSKDDNELLIKVGPGTPMGNLLRRYWTPALLSTRCRRPTARRCACASSAKTSSPSATRAGRVGLST